MIKFQASFIEKWGLTLEATFEGGEGGFSLIIKKEGRSINVITKVLAIKKNS